VLGLTAPQVGLQLYLKFRREHPTERILAFDTDFSKFVSTNVATLPTGGYFAVWLALARCAQVSSFKPAELIYPKIQLISLYPCVGVS
jgi:hypothetical protein